MARWGFFFGRAVDNLIPSEHEKIAGAGIMTTIKISEARDKLGWLVDEGATSHEPILIKGKRANAVLFSEDDWRAIQETLYLLSVPGRRESIREGFHTP